MSSQREKRLAVVGAGLIGKRHIDVIEQSPVARLAAIADPEPSAGKLATALGVPWFEDVNSLIDAELADGVIIASPNQMHVAHGLACVRAGIPVLVEKPIGSDSSQAIGFVEEAEAAKLPVLVGHHRRHNPIVQAAKARLLDGAIGTIVAVSGLCWLYKPDAYFDMAWRTREGAGPVFINLIHDIDLMRHFCGDVRSVQAFQSSKVRGYEVEDTAAIVLQFDSGVLATISVSDTIVAPWSWELTAGENPAYPETAQTCYVIGGTHGSLEIPGGRIWSNSGQRSWWEPMRNETYKVHGSDPLERQIAHFCRVISGDEKPLVSGREGLRSLQVIEAIKQSARLGKPVEPKT